MALRMRVLVCARAQERTRFSLEYFEDFVTIGVGGMDIDIALLVRCRLTLTSALQGVSVFVSW